MKAEFDLNRIDFRTTPIENFFLDSYLSMATGDAIKVYLYGWKNCYCKESVSFDLEQWASVLALSPQEVEESLAFWRSFHLIEEREENGERLLTFKSPLLLYTGFDKPSSREPEPAVDERLSIHESIRAEVEARREADAMGLRKAPFSGDQTEFFDPSRAASFGAPAEAAPVPGSDAVRLRAIREIEGFLTERSTFPVQLKPDEVVMVQNFLDEFPITAEYFVYAYKKAYDLETARSKNISYTLGIIDNWLRFEQLTDREKLDAFLEKQKEEKASKKRRTRKKAANVDKDSEMSKEERMEWLRDKMNRSLGNDADWGPGDD